ncbi:RNA polymerase factor sigma-54 [Psychrobacter lutiphocae]|uniref:RNA polymerase factor sigma-54 n=1 Tax=Psychrobacter lutiphocae TaxID=540500 RepID=UPI00036F0BD0|nr:RNA polymerase factor sigma-54 [Psychrobacter lutiphocae]
MSSSFNLGLNLSTSQKLTPQMQQAIKLLQLSSLELAQEVQNKIDNNPLLERDDDDELDTVSLDNIADKDALTEVATLDQETSLVDDPLGELTIDTEWEDIYIHSAGTGLARPDSEQMTDYQGTTATSLQDHIRWQLNLSHLSESEAMIADYLIDAMDDSGFIQLDTAELKANFDEMASFYNWKNQIELSQIDRVISLIQNCEPLGVGARNLAECLQIQLKALDVNGLDADKVAYRDKALRLLEAHELLVSNHIKQLLQQTGLRRTDIAPCLALIRTLNAAPGLSFVNTQPEYNAAPEVYDIPDVIVQLQQDATGKESTWKVSLNPETLPKLRVNKEYASLIKRGDNSPDNVYLRDNLIDARLFIRSIEERNQNLLKVATCIVERQQQFLIKGATAMQPLILKEVADAVGLHESTVSRLTTSKSILTPQGLFSLKHFFSSHVSGADGNVSATAISAMIAELIEQENPKKPLSDSVIAQHLQQQGIEVARRTVAKYREAMGISASTQRKVKF